MNTKELEGTHIFGYYTAVVIFEQSCIKVNLLNCEDSGNDTKVLL